ncbi:hypothetical protein [Curtobacterium sp. MCBD17_030]|uniref:hypothetical protein n=1 Tax=Curtobacterium sp. MCBD17_030 TaxID=2175649 RepID=UPI0015E8784E|nr:hypothetical protein [Curtobacterium sp. MCBD17_030]
MRRQPYRQARQFGGITSRTKGKQAQRAQQLDRDYSHPRHDVETPAEGRPRTSANTND